ncbi:MAG: ABC transporter substrate-binding protein [Candidatus Limivicinus sp.]|nr:ABC transporter substrate-binding protein [Candidatus Limivicinus sp.]
MRKTITFILLTVCLLMFSACTSEPSATIDDSDGSVESAGNELTIGVIGMSNFEGYAAKFNAETEREFTVRLVDYLGNGTREAAIARLNADLAVGKGPDIIDFDTVTSRDIYARQGLLRDMSDYFYREFRLDEFYALDLLNSTGPLYFFPSHFCVITAYGSPETFKNMTSWSIDDFARLSSLPQFADTPADTRESFMEKLHTSMIPRWLDLEQGVSRFDDGSFADALRFASTLSDVPYYSDVAPEILIAEGSLLYSEAWIYSPFDIRSIEQAVGGPAAYIGFPTPEGSFGSYMFMYGLTGVNATTKNADHAWEFIRFLLVEDNLINDKAWNGIPVLKSAVQKKVDYLLNPYAEYEGKTIIVNNDGTFEVDGVHQDMTYDPTPYITKSQAETFYSLLQRSNRAYELDTTAYEIMMNVAWRYFSDQCTLEDAVNQIQSRVSTYLSEQYG